MRSKKKAYLCKNQYEWNLFLQNFNWARNGKKLQGNLLQRCSFGILDENGERGKSSTLTSNLNNEIG